MGVVFSTPEKEELTSFSKPPEVNRDDHFFAWVKGNRWESEATETTK